MVDINEMRFVVKNAGLNGISGEEVLGLLDRIEAIEREYTKLRTLYIQDMLKAASEIESWGAYADEYFQAKHNLAGVVTDYLNRAWIASTESTNTE